MATTSRTHYENLGVAPTADTAEIKAAYRRLVRTLHPDMGGPPALFAMVAEAYEVLTDSTRRLEYDQTLTTGPTKAPSPTAPTAHKTRPRPSHDQTQSPNYPGFRATFSEEFRKANQEANHGRTRTRPGGPSPADQPTRPGRGTTSASRARSGPTYVAAGVRVAPPALAWWVYPVVLVTTLAAASVRFTGVTATLFGAHNGQRLLFGGEWWGTPQLIEDGDTLSSLVGPLVIIAVWCLFVTAGYWARTRRAPVPRTEKILLLAAWAVLVGAGEFLLATGAGWRMLFLLVGGYALWVWLVGRAPAPTSQEEWRSFSTWRANHRNAKVNEAVRKAASWRPPTPHGP